MSMPPAVTRPDRIEPEHLGPLGERPLAETAPQGAAGDLFPGASAFLSTRQQHRRREQWRAARPLADLLLQPEEHVLYVAHAMQVPPVLHAMALGAMALPYHQVMLVLTDRRLIEVLLGVRGKTAGTRLRSFPWNGTRDLRLSLAKLVLHPEKGRKETWRVPLRGDRKLLKLLMVRLQKRLLAEGAAAARTLPLGHCPKCGAEVSDHPSACGACRTTFHSPALATALALAFPGAGLFYVGHPFLAAMDLLGEAVLYAVFLMMMLQATPGTMAVAAAVGAVFFVLTKLHSVHLSRILVARTRPETEARRARYGRFALIGGMASMLLIGGVFPLAGAARPGVDRDLDAGGPDSAWQGSRNTAEWASFTDDATARSQWRHPSGLRLTLFAHPQGLFGDVDAFRDQIRRGITSQGATIVKDDEDVPSPFSGFRFVERGRNRRGDPVAMFEYFVVDARNHDIHQAVAASLEEDGAAADALVRDFLAHARWIPAVPPQRAAAAPQP